MLNKTLLAIGCAAVAMGLAAPAQAATTISFNLTPPTGTLFAGPVRCDAGPGTCPGAFTATGTFARPAGYALASIDIATSAINNKGNVSNGFNINFSSATFNGVALALSPTGVFETGSVSNVPLAALNTLFIAGTSGGDGNITGTITFSAIPEPATWALMMLGFAGVGLVIRRRRNTEVRASLQMA